MKRRVFDFETQIQLTSGTTTTAAGWMWSCSLKMFTAIIQFQKSVSDLKVECGAHARHKNRDFTVNTKQKIAFLVGVEGRRDDAVFARWQAESAGDLAWIYKCRGFGDGARIAKKIKVQRHWSVFRWKLGRKRKSAFPSGFLEMKNGKSKTVKLEMCRNCKLFKACTINWSGFVKKCQEFIK